MGRPKLSPRRHITVRMPEAVYAEMILLRPQMQDAQGYTKYGAISDYINSLVVRDLANIKTNMGPVPVPRVYREIEIAETSDG